MLFFWTFYASNSLKRNDSKYYNKLISQINGDEETSFKNMKKTIRVCVCVQFFEIVNKIKNI